MTQEKILLIQNKIGDVGISVKLNFVIYLYSFIFNLIIYLKNLNSIYF